MIKEQLYRKCIDILNNRIEKYKAELSIMKESFESDDKDSGDEDESGVGSSSEDIYFKNIEYLKEATQMKENLKKVDVFQNNNTAKIGSLVECSNGLFFISVPLGKIEMDDKIYFAISNQSPVGQLLGGKKEGDQISFNSNVYIINKIH